MLIKFIAVYLFTIFQCIKTVSATVSLRFSMRTVHVTTLQSMESLDSQWNHFGVHRTLFNAFVYIHRLVYQQMADCPYYGLRNTDFVKNSGNLQKSKSLLRALSFRALIRAVEEVLWTETLWTSWSLEFHDFKIRTIFAHLFCIFLPRETFSLRSSQNISKLPGSSQPDQQIIRS